MQFDKSSLRDFIPDSDKESVSGVWIEYPGGIRIRILRAGGTNEKFKRATSAALKPYRRQIERDMISNEVVTDLARRVYSLHIVVDWQNVRDIDGNAVPCTPSNVYEFFKAVPELFEDIQRAAVNLANFVEDEAEEAGRQLGN